MVAAPVLAQDTEDESAEAVAPESVVHGSSGKTFGSDATRISFGLFFNF